MSADCSFAQSVPTSCSPMLADRVRKLPARYTRAVTEGLKLVLLG
jgi:hypothetical protein